MIGQAPVLVAGADGLLGGALVEAWTRAGARVLGTSRRAPRGVDGRPRLDLAEEGCEGRLPGPVGLAYLCAAVTDLAACERDPAGTGRVNVDATVRLARVLASQGAFVVFPSTNLVFDGTVPHRRVSDPSCPALEYGRQKARVESALQDLGTSAAVLRLGKVVGPRTEPFASWVRALRRGEPVEAFVDKVCAPLALDDAIGVLRALGERRMAGTYQATAAADLRYDEAASSLARRVGAPVDRVRPVRGAERGVAEALRPAHTALDPGALAAVLGWSRPRPEVALAEGLGL
ncbi:MAG: sugar nucleotide-binding protein [Planctomycetes bacterium]|nr:sugar nucleotide-binding protein [Planctomycetota bacterium]